MGYFSRTVELIKDLEKRLELDSRKIFLFQNQVTESRQQFLEHQVFSIIQEEPLDIQDRIRKEFFGWGPLEPLLQDESITEIMINEYDQIWIEKEGKLTRYHDQFATVTSYYNFLQRFLVETKKVVTVENPVAEGSYKDFRIHYVGSEITQGSPKLCLRRQSRIPWTLDKLKNKNWCSSEGVEILKSILQERKNFLVVGNTGSGKTSLLGALIQELPTEERVILIEDTPELKVPQGNFIKLLTRESIQGEFRSFTQTDLLKSALRMRPDRLIVGEIRGGEAKDFLLALSTGHEGSFGSIHAHSSHQALMRLEMLVQMGAPFWDVFLIRRLIQISLHYIIVVNRKSSGIRALQEICKVSSLEENGFTLDCCYRWN